MLLSKSKQLHSMGIINSFSISGGILKDFNCEYSRPLDIRSWKDFTVHFPNVDLPPPPDSS